MNKYSVAELRQKTREVLNAAQTETVIITRYDEEFVLSKIASTVSGTDTKHDQSDVGKVVAVGKPIKTPADVGKVVPGSCVHGAAPGFCKVQKCPNSKRP